MADRDLTAEITAWLTTNPAGGTGTEIARAIKARTIDVLRVLADSPSFTSKAVGPSHTLRVVWSLRETGGERLSRGKHATQCDRLLACLADGKWWSTQDLLRRVPAVIHSRISNLRDRGHEIEHRTTGPGATGSFYRLVHDAKDVAA